MRSMLLSALVLSACTSIVPTTAMRLNSLSPTTADPADLAVALTLPAGIDVTSGSATMMFSVTRADLGQTREGLFVLQREGDVFMVDPGDYAQLRALQATARMWKTDADRATNGSLMISLAPCKLGDGPDDDARVSVSIRMQQDGAFLPLIRNGPLSAVTTAAQLRDMAACDGGQ